MRSMVIGAVLLSFVTGSFGCASKTGTGALVGGVGGAVVGGALGAHSGNAGKGALIGAAVGGVGGALVGNGMDQADRDRERREERDRFEYQRRYDDRYRADYRDSGYYR